MPIVLSIIVAKVFLDADVATTSRPLSTIVFHAAPTMRACWLDVRARALASAVLAAFWMRA